MNVLCKIFGHRFTTIYSTTKEPGVSVEDCNKLTNSWGFKVMMFTQQKQVISNITRPKIVQLPRYTYCKSCGMKIDKSNNQKRPLW